MPRPFVLASTLSLTLALGCATTAKDRVDFEPVRVVAEPAGPDALEMYDAETLHARGLDLMRGGAVSEAALYFKRVLDEFPGSILEVDALYNLAVCYIRAEQGEPALAAIDRYLELIGDDPDALEPGGPWIKSRLDGWFRRGQALALTKRYDAAAELFDVLVAEESLAAADQIEALVDAGVAHFMRGDRITSEYRFLKARRIHRAAKDHERLQVRYFMAQAGFYLAELARLEFSDYKLRYPTLDEIAESDSLEAALGRQLEEKCQLLLKAQYAFIRAIREQHPGWASASGYKVGAMYEELHREMVNLPPPEDLPESARDLFATMLEDRILILLEKALKVWQSTAEMATRTGQDNEWVDRTRESLERVKAYVLSKRAERSERG